MAHDNLRKTILTNFTMMQEHQWSLTEIEALLPWEKQVYVGMLAAWVEKENERYKNMQNS